MTAEFITLSCPSCGGKLQVTEDLNQFACAHCAAEHVVKRFGNTVSLAPVVDELKGVRAGVDKTASELALKRLPREIAELEQQYSALWKQREMLGGVLKILNRGRQEKIRKQMDQIMKLAKKKQAALKRHRKIVDG